VQTGELSELQAVSETQRDTLLLQISAHNDSGINQHLLIGNESVPIQLAQCRFSGLAISSAKILILFSNKIYTEAILSDSTRILLWFDITKNTDCSLRKKFYCVIYYNFWHTFVPLLLLVHQVS